MRFSDSLLTHSLTHSLNQSINQSTNQAINQSINHLSAHSQLLIIHLFTTSAGFTRSSAQLPWIQDSPTRLRRIDARCRARSTSLLETGGCCGRQSWTPKELLRRILTIPWLSGWWLGCRPFHLQNSDSPLSTVTGHGTHTNHPIPLPYLNTSWTRCSVRGGLTFKGWVLHSLLWCSDAKHGKFYGQNIGEWFSVESIIENNKFQELRTGTWQA